MKNNVKSSEFAWSDKGRQTTSDYLGFHLELNAALIRYAEVNLRRYKRW